MRATVPRACLYRAPAWTARLRAAAGAVLMAEQRASAALGRKFLYTVCKGRVARRSTPLAEFIGCNFLFLYELDPITPETLQRIQ